jgi:histidinol dehydrogenase
MVTLRFAGDLDALAASDRAALLDRSTSSDEGVRAETAEILARVRRDGDAALHEMAARFDGVRLERLEVDRARCRAALDVLDAPLRRALERAAANIGRAHRAFLPAATELETEPGVVVGRRPDPLGRVGVYAPGGRAAYPSSVLMGAIPARVAGVGEIVLCSPPSPETGLPSAIVLAAAALAGVDRIFAVGGAGAIAAMALGTATVPRVDRIVGPGNAWVAEAKLQVAGACAIDAPAGPSELLVVADESADAAVVAREMVAQAEHDPRACVVAVIVGEGVADAVERALAAAAAATPRRAIVEAALAGAGGVLRARTLDAALGFANEYAAEHLLLLVGDPEAALGGVRGAGTVFLGAASSVTFGDYATGANHVLPTGGLARSYSGLSTLDFVRWTTYQRVGPAAARRLASDVALLAEAEGLPAHAAAARAAGPAAVEVVA